MIFPGVYHTQRWEPQTLQKLTRRSTTMNTTNSRKRSLGVIILTVTVVVTGISFSVPSTNASITTETVLPDQDLHGEIYNEIVFDGDSGRIDQDISPNVPAEDYEIRATSISNISGHVAMFPKNVDMANFSDGYLDQTKIGITMRLDNNVENKATITLREWVTNGYISAEVNKNGNAVIKPGEKIHYTVRVIPTTTGEGFTNADLREVGQVFDLAFRFSDIDSAGQSGLSRWAVANGGKVAGQSGDAFYSIPISDLAVLPREVVNV
jgi:hypothetical protein